MELSFEAIVNVKKPALKFPFTVSPDGRWLALTLSSFSPPSPSKNLSSELAGSSLWLYDLRSGNGFEMISESGRSSWSGVWSPVENTLAFFSDADGEAGLWLWREDSGPERISKQVVRPFFGFESPIWTLDGRHILVKAMPSEEDNVESLFSNSAYNGPSKKEPFTIYSTTEDSTQNSEERLFESWVDRYLADIVKIDSETGELEQIVGGLNPVGMCLSPDGTRLIFANALGIKSPEINQTVYDLWVVSIGNQQTPRCIAKDIYMDDLVFTWFDHSTVVYITSSSLVEGGIWAVRIDGNENPRRLINTGKVCNYPIAQIFPIEKDIFLPANRQILRINSDTGEVTSVTKQWSSRITAVIPMEQPNGGRNLIVQTYEPHKGMSAFYRLNLTNGERELLLEEPRKHYSKYLGGTSLFKINHKDKIVYLAESENEAPTIFMLDMETKIVKKVGDFNYGVDPVSLGATKLILWQHGEQQRKGILMLPSNRNEDPVPVIVRVYGGMNQSENLRYYGCTPWSFENHHLFTSRGYAVFLPDLPIRGQEPAEDINQGLESAIRALSSQPEVDVKRIGVIGHSYGGYSALIGITRLKCFKAAIISAGIANLISFATHFDPKALNTFFSMVENGQFGMRETLWDNPERYIANSPLFDFDCIEAPVLVIQGTEDPLCYPQAGPIFSALRRLGKTAELIYYNGEGHSPIYWKRESIIDYLKRVVHWFEKHLK